MQAQYDIRGVLPVFQTPFHDDESIDFATLRKEIEWLFGLGCHGVVLGMVSEVLRLGTDERKRVVESVCEAAHGRGPVVISAGAESTVVAVDYARHAELAGAAALMVIPPVSVGVSEDELVRYYERILDAVSIPVIVQDASGYVGRPMSIPLQAGLYQRHGARVMFKPEATPLGPRLSDVVRVEIDKLGVLRNTVVRGPTGFVLDPHTRAEVDRLFALLERAAA